MAAIIPEIGTLNNVGLLRFWCQKVLPLTYDDSLSYYELLNKTINYLNHVIEDVQTLATATQDFRNYLIQFRDEVNNSITEWENNLTDELDTWKGVTLEEFESQIAEWEQNVEASFEQIKADAESARDIAILNANQAAANVQYSKGLLEDAKTYMDALYNTVVTSWNTNYLEWERGTLTASGNNETSTTRIRTALPPFKFPSYTKSVICNVETGYIYRICWYSYSEDTQTFTLVGQTGKPLTDETKTLLPEYFENGYYFRILLAKSDNTTISLDEIDTIKTKIHFEITPIYTFEKLYDDMEAINVVAENANETAEAANELINAVSNEYTDEWNTNGLQWERGSLSARGENTSAPNRIRTVLPPFKFPNYTKYCIASVDVGYTFRICWYEYDESTDTFTYKGQTGATLRSDPYTIPEEIFRAGYYFRILLAKADNTTITVEEVDTVKTKIHYRIYSAFNIEGLSDDVQAQQEEIGVLSTAINPTYPNYFEEQLENNCEAIKMNMLDAGTEGITFNFITDIHWPNNNKNSPNLLWHISKECGISLTICGGDIMRDASDNQNVSWVRTVTGLLARNTTLAVAVGNHDFYDKSSGETVVLTNAQASGLMNQDMLYKCDNANANGYFYFDSAFSKTRIIILNSMSGGTSSALTAELQTLSEWLDSTPIGYKVIIITHIYFKGTTTQGTTIDQLTINAFGTGIATAVDAYNASETANGKVIAIFAGHSHIDGNTATPGGVTVILTQCDARNSYSSTNVNETVDSQAFDSVTINYNTKQIKMVRTGRGSNREISYQ